MRILGIETTSKTCSAALVENSRVIKEISLREGLIHSEKLIPIIDKALNSTDWRVGDLDGIVVSSGPGSFTGIRIGVSAARALAQGLEIPLVGVISLDALAHGIVFNGGFICPLVDALRSEVYTSLYRKGKRIMPHRLVRIKDWIELIKKRDGKILFLGEACDIYEDRIKESLGDKAEVMEKPLRYASATMVALLGEKRLSRRGSKSYKNVLPKYIRRAEAEVKWKETRRRSKQHR